MFKDPSVCILTFQSPFAQLVAEIGRHLQVIISDLSYSIIKIIPCEGNLVRQFI